MDNSYLFYIPTFALSHYTTQKWKQDIMPHYVPFNNMTFRAMMPGKVATALGPSRKGENWREDVRDIPWDRAEAFPFTRGKNLAKRKDTEGRRSLKLNLSARR